MRLGVLLGFLIGAAIASLLGSKDSSQAEGDSGTFGNVLLEKLKQQTDEARFVAREASEEKQAEIMRDWEQSRHQDAKPS